MAVQFTTEFTRWDQVLFNIRGMFRTRDAWINILLFSLVGIPVLLYLVGLQISSVYHVVVLLIFSFIYGLSCMLFGYVYCILTVLLMPGKGGGIFGRHDFVMNAEGLREKN